MEIYGYITEKSGSKLHLSFGDHQIFCGVGALLEDPLGVNENGFYWKRAVHGNGSGERIPEYSICKKCLAKFNKETNSKN